MPEPGQKIGDFELIAEIGRGAVGTVWRATQLSLARTVAVKFLATSSHRDEAWVERFRSEAAESAKLSHPSILPVHAFGQTEDGQLWFAMELVDGEDLGERLTRDGALPPHEAARLARDAARALAHAHEQGVIHRDVKPANMMLRKDGRLAVTDFGLAKSLESGALTTTGLLIGTPYYMSPEAVEGDRNKIGPLTDVYGLGATLYELLVGRPPFMAENAVALIRMICDEEPTPPREFNKEIPAVLEAITLKAMAKKPENRFASAKEFSEALDVYLGETMPSTLGAISEIPIPARRRRIVPWLAAGVLVLGAIAGILLLALRETGQDLEETKEQLDEAKEDQRITEVMAFYKDFAEASWSIIRAFVNEDLADEPSPAYLEQWTDVEPARLAIEATPEDAKIAVLHLPGDGAYGTWKPTEADADIPPGLYRIHVSAENHQTQIVTALLRPGANETIRVQLLRPLAGRPPTIRFRSLLLPKQQDDGSLYGPLVRAGSDVDIAIDPVLVEEYEAFLNGLEQAERRRFMQTGPNGRRGGRRPSPENARLPVVGVPRGGANAYARAAEARLPTRKEMLLVLGIATRGDLVAKHFTPEKQAEWSQLVAAQEGLRAMRTHTCWVRGDKNMLSPMSMRLIRRQHLLSKGRLPEGSGLPRPAAGIRLAFDAR